MNGSRRRRSGGRLIGALVGAAALWLGAAAPAQTTPPPANQPLSAAKPPTAKVPDKPPLLGNIVAGLFILSVVVTASLLPSKRGHQD
jgi:hypothetical protein